VAGRAFDDFGMLGFIGEFILPSGHADSETDNATRPLPTHTTNAPFPLFNLPCSNNAGHAECFD
jgi:hypothetical protein